MELDFIYPPINSDTEFFWNGCKEHRLVFQKCSECNLIRWPPSFLCPNCHSQKYELVTSSGRGTIFSFVVYHKSYHRSFDRFIPYITAVIILEEGVRFLSRIIVEDTAKIQCEMEVDIKWDNTNNDYPIPLFKLTS